MAKQPAGCQKEARFKHKIISPLAPFPPHARRLGPLTESFLEHWNPNVTSPPEARPLTDPTEFKNGEGVLPPSN